tara:strand:- start:140 stop:901 length:762 start_codon:yes stop_codon:yes gene_type:complete
MNKETLKKMIKEVILENRKKSVLLYEGTFLGTVDKINVQNKPFFVLSAQRSERTPEENELVDQKVRDYLESLGLSWQVVQGGYVETVPVPDGEGEMKQDVNEKSYIVFGDEPHRGDEVARITDQQSLFDIAKDAANLGEQEAFIFGGPLEVKVPGADQSQVQMYIAMYDPAVTSGIGPAGKISAPWAGPWYSYEELDEDDLYFTKTRKTKGKFAEEKIAEIKRRKVSNKFEALERDHDLRRWKNIKSRYRRGR